MIHPTTGDLFEADVEAFVNPVNCVGVMGKGLALQFKRRFPAMFEDYRRAAKVGALEPGRLHVYEAGPQLIINLPTKRHWRSRARLEDVEAGLTALAALIEARGIRSVALPALGVGLGGLDWEAVRPLIIAALAPLEGVDVRLYAPR